MAYHPFHMVPGVCVLSTGTPQATIRGPADQPDPCVPADRSVARTHMDVHCLGAAAWSCDRVRECRGRTPDEKPLASSASSVCPLDHQPWLGLLPLVEPGLRVWVYRSTLWEPVRDHAHALQPDVPASFHRTLLRIHCRRCSPVLTPDRCALDQCSRAL